MATDQIRGTRDITYDLISVIYHALQGGETFHTYILDAEKAGDGELAKFFRDAEQQHMELANRAKQLLETRLNKGG